MTHDSPGSHFRIDITHFAVPHQKKKRKNKDNAEGNTRHEWVRWHWAGIRIGSQPSRPISLVVPLRSSRRRRRRPDVVEPIITDDDQRMEGWMWVGKWCLRVIRIKRHHLSRRCVSPPLHSTSSSLGELERPPYHDVGSIVEAKNLKVSMYKSDKNQFQSFWGNFLYCHISGLPDPIPCQNWQKERNGVGWRSGWWLFSFRYPEQSRIRPIEWLYILRL